MASTGVKDLLSSFVRWRMMSEGRRTQVLLLDDRRLDILVQPRLMVGELLNIVASHCQLKDPDKIFFGLAFFDEKQQCHWLQIDRRVLDHEYPRKFVITGATLVLHHLPKFYAESITQLSYTACVELMFLQAKQLIYKGVLDAECAAVFQLGAYAMQVHFGDFNNAQVARSNIKRLALFPTKVLKEYTSGAECENRVLELYENMFGMTKGAAVVNYMTMVERLHNYGVHFYEVKDKSGASLSLGISSRGVFQYDLNSYGKPKKGFHWKQLEHLYYRDRKFSIEVHDPKRIMHTLSSFNLYEDAIQEPVENHDDLIDAVRDPTTQVSVSRRAFVPSNVHVHVFWCDSPQLCKTIWSLAIAQHQFYLDRRSAAKQGKHSVMHTPRELTDKLDKNMAIIPMAPLRNDSDRDTSDLTGTPSSSSLHSIPSTTSAERSDAEKQKELEFYRYLKLRKQQLEELMVQKMKELKDVCIREGEITGELPQEIRRALTPGEPEPKIKRRVGTAFAITSETMTKHTKADQIAKLEADVDIHKKIVAAALKLASDSTTNKSVRRKRRKDYEAARQRLRELEQRLHQLRLSSSKPDLPSVHLSDATLSSYSEATNGFRVSKSLPTTPRGSVPDLSVVSSESRNGSENADQIVGTVARTFPNKPPNLPLPPPSPRRKQLQQQCSIKGLSYSTSFPNSVILGGVRPDLVNGIAGPILSIKPEPTHGYRSHTAYQSTYRTQHYPTLNNGSARAGSSHSLQSSASSSSVPANGDCQSQTLSTLTVDSCRVSDVVEHSVGTYNIPNQRTSWDYESLSQMNSALLGSSESLNIGVSSGSAAGLPPKYVNGRGAETTNVTPTRSNVVSNLAANCYTGSLDRRLLKQRQRERWRPQASGEHQQPQQQLLERMDRSPTRYGHQPFPSSISPRFVHKLLAQSPVIGQKFQTANRSVESSKPYETTDYLKYSNTGLKPSATGTLHSPSSSPSHQLIQRSLSQSSPNHEMTNGAFRFGSPKRVERWWTSQVQQTSAATAPRSSNNLSVNNRGFRPPTANGRDDPAWYEARQSPSAQKTATIV